MAIKKIEVWQTEDGQLWRDEKEAQEADDLYALKHVYNSIPMGRDLVGETLPWIDFWTWAQEHRFFLRDLVRFMDEQSMFGR